MQIADSSTVNAGFWCSAVTKTCQVFSDMFYVIFSSILKLLCDKLREFQCVGLVAAAACVALCELHWYNTLLSRVTLEAFGTEVKKAKVGDDKIHTILKIVAHRNSKLLWLIWPLTFHCLPRTTSWASCLPRCNNIGEGDENTATQGSARYLSDPSPEN